MHINTTICVVLLHGKLNNIIIQDWFILFERISFLISDLYLVENMPKKSLFEHTWTHDVVWKSVLFAKLMIIPPYHLLLAFIDQQTACFEFFLKIFSQIKEKYVFLNKNLILEYVEGNNFYPHAIHILSSYCLIPFNPWNYLRGTNGVSEWGSEYPIPSTLENWDHSISAPSDGPARVAWRALEILVVFTTASKREGTCPMKVKQSLAWYV